MQAAPLQSGSYTEHMHILQQFLTGWNTHCRWWPSRKHSAQHYLLSSVKALPYVALCASVLALGLIAGFILASPLAPQVPFPQHAQYDLLKILTDGYLRTGLEQQ